MDSPFGTFDIEKLYCKHYIHNILAAQIIENCEKEDKEMISAKDAKEIADSNKDIWLFLKNINNCIKTKAHRGKYEHKEYYGKNSDYSKVVDVIKEKLEERGYVVSIANTRKAVDGDIADFYDCCMIITWK